jgi:hypothetical protein
MGILLESSGECLGWVKIEGRSYSFILQENQERNKSDDDTC